MPGKHSSASIEQVLKYSEEHEEAFLQDITTLCNQKSISKTDEGTREAAELVKGFFEDLGAEVHISDPKSPRPVIYAKIRGEKEMSVLLYNHYDTQPAGDLSLWKTDPFVTTVLDGRIIVRGISDNKGDLMSRIHAVRAFLETRGRLPVTVKFITEGEEEIGSPNLPAYFAAHAKELKSDVALWEGATIDAAGRPSLSLGTKGRLTIRLTVENQNWPLHTLYGALIENPAWRLVWALATLVAPDDSVLIPGFHDAVQALEPAAEELVRALPFDEQELRRTFGVSRFVGGRSGEALKRHFVLSPFLTINALEAGTEDVVPAKATAIVAFGLAPGQDPDDIYEKFCSHLRKSGFADVSLEKLAALPPYRSPLAVNSPLVSLARQALQRAYRCEPRVFPYSAGASPCYLLDRVSTPCLDGIGVDWEEDNVHGPNENIRLADYMQGTKALCFFLDLCGTGMAGK